MALRNVLTLRRSRSGRLEGRTALIQGPFSVSSVVELRHDCVQGICGEWSDTSPAMGVLFGCPGLWPHKPISFPRTALRLWGNDDELSPFASFAHPLRTLR